MNEDLDNELRTAVRSHSESVQPNDRLWAIRTRTQDGAAVQWWRRPSALAAGAALVATSLVVAGVALVGQGPAGTETPPAAGDQYEVTVYELGVIGERYWLYPKSVSTANTGDAALDAVRAVVELGDVTASEGWWGLGGCPATDVRSVKVAAEVVTVDLDSVAEGSGSVCALTRIFSQARLQQLAWTLRSATGTVPPVRLTVDGEQAGGPVSADPAALSPVLIESPADGDTVSGPVRVTGTSDTFEANVRWQVLQDGEVVDEGLSTGGTMGARAPFRFTVDLPPGEYTVRAYETSAEDGSLFAEDTTTFTVR